MTTGYRLVDDPNPHAKKAGYAHGYWGHPSRTNGRPGIRLVVLHTTEQAFDTLGPDTTAEALATYLADNATRAASYHDVVDRDSHVQLLPWAATAFGAKGYNSNAIHIAVAGTAADWDRLTATEVAQYLEQLTPVVAAACAWADIPTVRLTAKQATGDGRGLCGHTDVDPPPRRTDPGADFPWRQLHDRLTPTTSKETGMALTPDEEKFVRALKRSVESVGSAASFAEDAIKLVREHRAHPHGTTTTSGGVPAHEHTAKVVLS